MRKTHYLKKYWYILFTVILVMACETTRDTYEEFYAGGESIYIGKPNTITVNHGNNKVRITLNLNSDPKITKGKITSLDGSINYDFDINRSQNGSEDISIELDLVEKDYVFNVILSDNEGNTSIPKEIITKVYGEKYRTSLLTRSIETIDKEPNIVVKWGVPPSGAIETILTYLDASGTEQVVVVANEDSETILPSITFGSEFKVENSFYPEAGAFEKFFAKSDNKFANEQFLVDNTLVTGLNLPFDASDGCYSSSTNYSQLLDGVTGAFWHSCPSAKSQYPFIMSFDMGTPISLAKFKLDKRSACCGDRSPANMQFWGTNDISGETTVDIDVVGLAMWEADATAKGWVKVGGFKDNSDHTLTKDITASAEKYKYLRLVFVSAINGGATANFDELTFWTE